MDRFEPRERVSSRSREVIMAALELAQRTFDVLHAQAPAHHALLAGAIAELSLVVHIGGEAIRPAVDADRIVAHGPEREPAIAVRTHAAALLDLIDGRDTLAAALRSRRLEVIGHRAAVASIERALRIYVHGLVRCASAPTL